MRWPSREVVLVALPLVGAAVGFWAGRASAPTGEAPSTAAFATGVERSLLPGPTAGRDGGPGGSGDESGSLGSVAGPDAETATVEDTLDLAYATLTSGTLGIRGIVEVFDLLGEVDAAAMPELLGRIEALPDFQQKNLLYLAALSGWADRDGAGAVRHAMEAFEGEQRASMVATVMSSWASREPGAALAWVEALERPLSANPNLDHPVVRNLFQGIGAADFDLAMERLGDIDDYDLRLAALDGLGASLRDDGRRGEFLDYVATLEDRAQRTRATNAALGPWAHGDPEAAATWVESLEAGSERSDAARTVSHPWFQQDPEAASAWYLEQVGEKDYAHAVRDLAQRWVRKDPAAAGEWLSGFEPGPKSDPAVAAYARSMVTIDPNAAVEWAASISDEGARERSLVDVFKQWRVRDATAAEVAVRSAGLGEEQVASILSGD